MGYNSVMIELQRCNEREAWDDFVLENKGHPLQLWGWGQVKASHGWLVDRFFAMLDDEVVGVAQVLIRPLPFPFRSYAYIPKGPIIEDNYQAEFLDLLSESVKLSHHSVALTVEPDAFEFTKPKGWIRSKNNILSAETILLDLSKSESELLSVMAKKTRQYIRKSSADVRVRLAKNRDDVLRCLEIYKETARRAGFSLHSSKYYNDVFINLRDNSPVFMAFEGDNLVAFLWLAITDATSYELYGGVNDRGQELRANYALKWFAIKKTKEWGIAWYDFGGLISGGVSTFKQHWALDTTLFVGTFDKPLSVFYRLWDRGLPLAKKMIQKISKIKNQN